VTESASFNKRLQLQQETVTNPAIHTLMDHAFNYGPQGSNNGNVMSVADQLNPARTQSFTYDPLNRLATANESRWGLGFVYDPWGNRLQQNVTAGTAGTSQLVVHYAGNSFIVKDPLISEIKFDNDVGVAVDAFGARDICTEILFRTTERGRRWANRIEVESAVIAPQDRMAFRLKRLGELSVESSEDKADIGLPFDVVELSKDGVRWVYAKKGCQKSQ